MLIDAKFPDNRIMAFLGMSESELSATKRGKVTYYLRGGCLINGLSHYFRFPGTTEDRATAIKMFNESTFTEWPVGSNNRRISLMARFPDGIREEIAQR